MSRLVIEEPCEHDVIQVCTELVCAHPLPHMPANAIDPECWCPGGSRTVLTKPDYEAAAEHLNYLRGWELPLGAWAEIWDALIGSQGRDQ